MSTATLTEDVVRTTTSKEPEKSAHIVLVPEHLKGKISPQSYVLQARVEGTPVKALCGHTWVPSRSASDLPICEPCLEIYQHDPKGHEDRGDLPDE